MIEWVHLTAFTCSKSQWQDKMHTKYYNIILPSYGKSMQTKNFCCKNMGIEYRSYNSTNMPSSYMHLQLQQLKISVTRACIQASSIQVSKTIQHLSLKITWYENTTISLYTYRCECERMHVDIKHTVIKNLENTIIQQIFLEK